MVPCIEEGFWKRAKERFVIWFVWKLPRIIIYWATIRLTAEAGQGKYSSDTVDELTAMDALDRWEEHHLKDNNVKETN